ncbi:MAG TPA: hypothetical protein PLY87_19820 [Planctomycetaceae bacterium]|nr:hypothetical protein [Planctomycetaceae bacterium]HQZ67352.1 hypothetical protein [Planctomycetaceae bacterium]
MTDLEALLPGIDRKDVKKLMDELRDEGRVHIRGERRWARWYPGPDRNIDET